MKVEIRFANERDAATLARLRYELRSSLHEVVESEATFVSRCAQWMKERLRDDSNWRCWIAEGESTPVGAVWAQLVEKIPNPIAEPESFVYLTNFYVRAEHRGEGIGSMLLTAVLDWAKSSNAQAVILWPTERSRPLYLRHDFSAADDLMEFSRTRSVR